MKLKEFIRHLTKYYAVFVTNTAARYDDQTDVPDEELEAEVDTLDFFEDDGDGEMLMVSLHDADFDSMYGD